MNLINDTYGLLTVIRLGEKYISPKGRKEDKWICLCECGNETEVRQSDLRSGQTLSCGCITRKRILRINKERFIDIAGQKFGMLTVLNLDHMDKQYGGVWNCICDCGINTIVKGINLKNGNTISCGCMGESKIATDTKRYFINNYGAKKEYKIIKNPLTNRWLRYDIYIPDNIFIELHGNEHYEYKELWNKNDGDFQKRQDRDSLKKNYAQDHGLFIEVDLRNFETSEQVIAYILNTL